MVPKIVPNEEQAVKKYLLKEDSKEKRRRNKPRHIDNLPWLYN